MSAEPSTAGGGFPRRALLLSVLASFVIAIAAAGLLTRFSRKEPPLPRLGGIPGFVLYDQDSLPFPSSRLDDRVWIADFFFTRCGGICPVLTARMRWLQDELGRDPAWHLVSITVDPAHDPPGVLTAYMKEHGADPERWTFLTGDPELVKNVVSVGFRLAVDVDSTSTVEPFLHSKSIVLVDHDAQIRGYYDSSDDEAMKKLLRDARRLLREIPR